MDFPYLENALNALERIENDRESLDDALDHLKEPDLRRSTANLLFTLFRRKSAIDAFLKTFERRKTAQSLRLLLEAATVQMRFQTAAAAQAAANAAVEYAKRRFGRGAANFANFVLHRVSEAPETAFAARFPEPLRRRWSERMSRKTFDELELLLSKEADFSFRLCGDTVLPSEATRLQNPSGVPEQFRFAVGDAGSILSSDALRSGAIYIQDPAAGLAPGLTVGLTVTNVLDLCAAPGGKSLLLHELHPSARFCLSDRSEVRQKLTQENVQRHHLDAEIYISEAWTLPKAFYNTFDLVVADVPCSNTGVFRRRPDALHRFSEESLAEIRVLQDKILDAAAPNVKPNGVLLYSTCSIEPEENELAVADFVRRHPEFRIEKTAALLPQSDADGAFGALLRRQ